MPFSTPLRALALVAAVAQKASAGLPSFPQPLMQMASTVDDCLAATPSYTIRSGAGRGQCLAIEGGAGSIAKCDPTHSAQNIFIETKSLMSEQQNQGLWALRSAADGTNFRFTIDAPLPKKSKKQAAVSASVGVFSFELNQDGMQILAGTSCLANEDSTVVLENCKTSKKQMKKAKGQRWYVVPNLVNPGSAIAEADKEDVGPAGDEPMPLPEGLPAQVPPEEDEPPLPAGLVVVDPNAPADGGKNPSFDPASGTPSNDNTPFGGDGLTTDNPKWKQCDDDKFCLCWREDGVDEGFGEHSANQVILCQ